MRFEAWTLPWNPAGFYRVIADIPAVGGSGSVRFSDYGEASITVPADYDRLTEIISDSTATLIRVYDETTLIQEFLAERVASRIDDTGTVTISGGDIASVFDRAVIYPFDYPTNPSNESNWTWGSDNNLITNPGFETGTNLIENPGFESGEVDPWWAGAVDGVSATLTIDTARVDTGTYAARCYPILTEGGMSTTVDGLVGGKTYTVTARVWAPGGQTMQIGCDGPQSIGIGTATRILYIDANPQGFEAQKDFTGTSAFQTVSFNFVAGQGQTSTQLSIRAVLTYGDFWVDNLTFTGYGAGMEPWQPDPEINLVTVFEASTTVARTGTYSGKVTAANGTGIHLDLDGVDEGVTHTASIWMRNTSGAAVWSLELRDQLGTRLAQTAVTTSTSWQQATVTVVLPADLPGDRRRLEIWIVNRSGATDTVYLDDAILIVGQAAATPGTILGQLLDDATLNHAADPRGVILDWVDYSGFTASTDTDGTAWGASISFVAYRGATYTQTFDRMVDQGYEWRLVAKTSPTTLTHDLEWYVADGLGSLLDAATSPTLTVGTNVTSGPIVQRLPAYTAVLVEGDAGNWTEDTDATALTNFGRAEYYTGDRGLVDAISRAKAGDALLAAEASNRAAVQVQVSATEDHPRPLVDYRPGDRLYFQFPPTLTKQVRRVRQIDWRHAEPAQYTVTGSRIFEGEAAAFEGIRRLLRAFRPLSQLDPSAATAALPDTGDGKIPWLVAAVDSDIEYRNAAGYVCTGTADHETIQEAFTTLGSGAQVVLAPGSYYVDEVPAGYCITLPTDGTLSGMGGGFDLVGIYPITNFTSGLGVIACALNSTVENLSIITGTGTKGVVVPSSAHATRIRRVYINTTHSYPIHCQGADNLLIDGVYLFEAGDTVANIRLDSGSDQARITQTRTFNGLVGIEAEACDELLIDHCLIEFPHSLGIAYTSATTGVLGLIISNNSIVGVGGDTTATDAAIRLVGPSGGDPLSPPGTERHGPMIVGNYIYNAGGINLGHGIMVSDLEAPIIADNQLHIVSNHGIYLSDVERGNIHGNVVAFVSGSDSQTYDGIHLDSDTNETYVHGNVVIDQTSPMSRYGLRINSADCDNNVIVGNMLVRSGTVADYSDAGTGTINTYPSGPVAGDNFVGTGPAYGGGLYTPTRLTISLPTPRVAGHGARPAPVTVAIGVPQAARGQSNTRTPAPVTVAVTLPQAGTTTGAQRTPGPVLIQITLPRPGV